MRVIQENNNGYTFGSAVTIATMEETLKDCIEKLPGELRNLALILKQSNHALFVPLLLGIL